MVELFGPVDGSESFENDYFANAVNSLSSNGDGRKNGGCVHEDGGRFAVFQSTEGDAVRGREHIAPLFIHSFHSIALTLISNIFYDLSSSPFVLSFFCSFALCFFFLKSFSVSKVSPGVFRGPLFKVVSCACAKDKLLKVCKSVIEYDYVLPST